MDKHSPLIKIDKYFTLTSILTITNISNIDSIMNTLLIVNRNIKIERIRMYLHPMLTIYRILTKTIKVVETSLVIRKIIPKLKVRLVAILVVFSINE